MAARGRCEPEPRRERTSNRGQPHPADLSEDDIGLYLPLTIRILEAAGAAA